MSEVVIAGIGQIPVGEHWELSLRSMAAKAILAARHDAGGIMPDALYVGNFLGSTLSHQSNLGSLIADNTGLDGAEGWTVEAADASGGGAFRLGYLAVSSGFVDAAVVVGVEKCTDVAPAELEAAAVQATDYDYESMQGITLTSQAALLMQRYLYEYDVPREALGAFPLLAHANGANNPNAFFQKPIRPEAYLKAGEICSPLNLFDQAPYGDGAAAVILTRPELIKDKLPHALVRVLGSGVVIDAVSLHDRHSPLSFKAAGYSIEKACRQAGILPTDADFFELSDSFSIYAALSLEAAGFAERGTACRMAQEGAFNLQGELPIATMGGMKARGNPFGASGVYQIVEAATQLRGQAGKNQIAEARLGLVQSLGGPASTAITHVLERWH